MRKAVPALSSLSAASRRCLVVLGVAAAVLAFLTPSAPLKAQGSGASIKEEQRPRKRAQVRRPATAVNTTSRASGGKEEQAKKAQKSKDDKKNSEAKNSARPLFAVVSLGDQRISVYNHRGLVTRSVVSTGMAGHRTPTGIFTIIGRERFHRSNIYSGAPMPFMQRITWSGVAMHLGVVPGYPASHGCIRLPSRFAAELWRLTKIGERVVIAPRDTAPAEFSHALLPVPKMQADPNAPGGNAAGERGIVTGTTPGEEVVRIAATGSGTLDPPSTEPASQKLLNPTEYAAAYKIKATADSAKAAKAAKDAFDAASAKAAEARRAVAEVKALTSARNAAESKVASAAKALAEVAPDALAAAEAAKASADAELSQAEVKLNEAKAAEPLKTAESFEAVRIWKDATREAAAAAEEVKAAARRASPVSVLVSKKDQRVYVRQGLAPLLEASASVREPENPLGTHVYIASAAGEDGASLKWSVISMPVARGSAQKSAAKDRKKSARDQNPAVLEPPRPASSPAEALERIEIPTEIRDRISELLWTGGSMIITDQPLSGETSDQGTDLVVTMR